MDKTDTIIDTFIWIFSFLLKLFFLYVSHLIWKKYLSACHICQYVCSFTNRLEQNEKASENSNEQLSLHTVCSLVKLRTYLDFITVLYPNTAKFCVVHSAVLSPLRLWFCYLCVGDVHICFLISVYDAWHCLFESWCTPC